MIQPAEPEKMEAADEEIHFYIFKRLQPGDDCKKIHENLQAVNDNGCLAYRTVCRWVEQLGGGKPPLN